MIDRKRVAGLSIRALATATGLSPSTIYRSLRDSPSRAPDENGMISVYPVKGLDFKIRPSRRFDTTARDQSIRDLRADGASMRAIASAVGCSVGTVHRVLTR